MNTVTANDFALEIKINETLWGRFLAKEENFGDETISRGEKFTKFLTQMIEDTINPPHSHHRQEIALIEYDFQYIQLLKLLSKRGRYIKKLKYPNRREIEAQIEQYIRGHMEDLRRPLHAFVILEHSEGVNQAMQTLSKGKFE
jgi:hypothetical protein